MHRIIGFLGGRGELVELLLLIVIYKLVLGSKGAKFQMITQIKILGSSFENTDE